MQSSVLLGNAVLDGVVGVSRGLAELWRLWLPLLIGGAAIYLLLPRPRPLPWLWGTLAGVAALILGGGLIVRMGAVSPEIVLFYAFSAIAIASGTLLVTQQNPARAALSFAVVILSTCGLFLLLAAPFLMAATIIIYAGAIIVTFLFVLMLAQQEGRSDADARSREPLLATITGFVLLSTILYVLRLGYDTRDIDRLLTRVQEASKEETVEAMRQAVGDTDRPEEYLFQLVKDVMIAQGWKDLRNRAEDAEWRWPFDPKESVEAHRRPLDSLHKVILEARARQGTIQPPGTLSALSGPPAGTPVDQVRRDPRTGLPQMPAENAAYLGRSLFTDYLLPVELGGLLLLAATVGAIAIGQHRGERKKIAGVSQ